MLYPEDPGNLQRVKDRPEHRFFKAYGEAMPKGDWNHPGTKQGIYMIGPDAEYLEGKFAASSDPADIRARLTRALERWNELRAEKGYANKPVPAKKATCPPDVEGELVLRVNLRDLPRGGESAPVRYEDKDRSREGWLEFTKWAWNENWIGFPSADAFLPASGDGWSPLDSTVVRRICREVLVDNVRGQAPGWEDAHVLGAKVEARRTAEGIEYRGSVKMDDGQRGYEAKMYGRGRYDPTANRFTKLDWVFLGTRRGASRFNQRENDRGPAPMGVTLSLFQP